MSKADCDAFDFSVFSKNGKDLPMNGLAEGFLLST